MIVISNELARVEEAHDPAARKAVVEKARQEFDAKEEQLEDMKDQLVQIEENQVAERLELSEKVQS